MNLFATIKEDFQTFDNCGYPLSIFSGAIQQEYIWIKNATAFNSLKLRDVIQRVKTLEKFIVVWKEEKSLPFNPQITAMYIGIEPYKERNINSNKSYW